MKAKNDSAEFASDAERLAAIRKTAEELAEPPGTDIKLLVGQALDTYWAAREKFAEESEQNPANELSFVNETIALARAAARKMVSWHQEFLSDLISTLAPTVATLVLLLGCQALIMVKGAGIPKRELLYLTAVVPLLVGIVAIFLIFRVRNRLKKWEFVQHSLGAIAGGAILASILLGYSARQRVGRLNVSKDLSITSVALAQDQLEELVLSSMEKRHTEGRFLETSDVQSLSIANNKKMLELTTQQYANQRVVYGADTKGLEGSLVADVKVNQGDLYLQDGGARALQSQFFFGKVIEEGNNSFSIQIDGSSTPIKLSRGVLVPKPIPGSFVAVAIDPKTKTAMKLVMVSESVAQNKQ